MNLRYTAIMRVAVGFSTQTYTLPTDHDTREQALAAAIKHFGFHAERHITIISFTVEHRNAQTSQNAGQHE